MVFIPDAEKEVDEMMPATKLTGKYNDQQPRL